METRLTIGISQAAKVFTIWQELKVTSHLQMSPILKYFPLNRIRLAIALLWFPFFQPIIVSNDPPEAFLFPTSIATLLGKD